MSDIPAKSVPTLHSTASRSPPSASCRQRSAHAPKTRFEHVVYRKSLGPTPFSLSLQYPFNLILRPKFTFISEACCEVGTVSPHDILTAAPQLFSVRLLALRTNRFQFLPLHVAVQLKLWQSSVGTWFHSLKPRANRQQKPSVGLWCQRFSFLGNAAFDWLANGLPSSQRQRESTKESPGEAQL